MIDIHVKGQCIRVSTHMSSNFPLCRLGAITKTVQHIQKLKSYYKQLVTSSVLSGATHALSSSWKETTKIYHTLVTYWEKPARCPPYLWGTQWPWSSGSWHHKDRWCSAKCPLTADKTCCRCFIGKCCSKNLWRNDRKKRQESALSVLSFAALLSA